MTKLGSKTLTNHNITNELAEAFLSDNPDNRIALFVKYPRDWSDRVNGCVKVEAEEAEEPVLEVKKEAVVPKVLKSKKSPKKRSNNKKK